MLAPVAESAVTEVVVCDDGSQDLGATRHIVRACNRAESGAEGAGRIGRGIARVLGALRGPAVGGKIRLVENPENVGPLRNKWEAVRRCRGDWVVLLDSDNKLSDTYVRRLCELDVWDPETIYCPDYGGKALDYREFSGLTVTRANVRDYLDSSRFRMLLNTGNFFVPRARYESALAPVVDERVPTQDVQFACLHWLKHDGRLQVVPGLEYFHRAHADSNWKRHSEEAEVLSARFREELAAL